MQGRFTVFIWFGLVLVAGSSGYEKELPVSIKDGEFIDELSDFYLFEKESRP
jgi:hypothetical protein